MSNLRLRKHAFEPPYANLQIATWILLPLLLLHFYVFLYQLLWSPIVGQVFVLFIFTLGSVCTSLFGFLTCITDPSDDACILKRDGKEAAVITDYSNKAQCYICDVILNKTSKHCGDCGKCVDKFDHHCVWLNTCIGIKNYKYFISLVISVFVMTTTSLVLSLMYLIEVLNPISEDGIIDRSKSGIVNLPKEGLIVILILSLIVLIPLVGLVIQLLGFHVVINRRGMTTYEFVVEQQRLIHEERRAAQQAREAAANNSDNSNNDSGDIEIASSNSDNNVNNNNAVVESSSPVSGKVGSTNDSLGNYSPAATDEQVQDKDTTTADASTTSSPVVEA